MVRDALGKVMWVGRATVFCVGLAVILALVIGTASVALAAVPGDPFKLGQVNSINRLSTLVGNTTGPMLRVQNKGAGSAADLRVQAGKPPMTVNSTGRVPRLNADMVDGKHAGAFLPKGSKAADAELLDGKDSTAFLPSGGKAADADKLDGKDSTDFYAAGSKVANADRLDGFDSTDFVRPRWAVIRADGTIARDRHVSTALTRKLGTGHYQVDFIGGVHNCAYVATTTGGFAGQIGVQDGAASYLVEVFTTNSAGTRVDLPFHVVVTC